jgi:hypothetical protein
LRKLVASFNWPHRSVVLLAICLAVSVGVLVGGTGVAFASTCSTEYLDGYIKPNTLPNVGQSVTAQIDLVSSLVHGGYVKGYIEVEVNADHYLRIGVRDQGDGAHIFIGDNGATTQTFTAVKQNFYTVSISRDSTNGYSAHYNGVGYPYTLTGTGETNMYADADNTAGSTCNQMDYYFRNIGPYNTNGMTEFIFPSGPYSVRTLSTTEFEADGS